MLCGYVVFSVFQDRAKKSLQETLNAIKCQEFGVYVQASTLGSLEALVEFLNQSKIPVRIKQLLAAPLHTSAYPCAALPVCCSTCVLLYLCAALPVCCSTRVLLYQCAALPVCCSTCVQLHLCAALPVCCSTRVQYFGVNKEWVPGCTACH